MGFIPTGPITIASAAVVWSLSLYFLWRGDRAQRHIAVAFLLSWVAARLATVAEAQAIAAVGWTVAAAVAFLGTTGVARAIAALYALRLLVLSMVGIWLSWYTFWELNRVLFYLQIALAFGTLINGPLAVSSSGLDCGRRRDPARPVLARWRHIFRS